LTKLGDANIVRKIILVLPHSKYESIITILHNMEDLSKMTLAIVTGKLVAFEMSRKMGQEEASSSSKSIALICGEKKKKKGKQVETSSSSSSSSEEEEEDDDDDDDVEESSDDDQASISSDSIDNEETIKLIQGVEMLIRKLNVKGVPIQIEDCIFTNRRRESKERMDAMDAAREGTLWKIVQLTSPHPRIRKRRRHARPRLSQQSRLGMIHQVKMKPNTRGAAASRLEALRFTPIQDRLSASPPCCSPDTHSPLQDVYRENSWEVLPKFYLG
jgi:hypothetical protein